jgi:hypothetical protein
MVAFDSQDRPWFIDERCDQYESEWRASGTPRIADYLSDLEGEARLALWLELVMLDQELRRGRGETPTLADYAESCPERMVWLDLSTDEPDQAAELEAGALEATDAGRVAGPIGALVDAERTTDRPEPIADPEATEPASGYQPADATDLPSTAGRPNERDADGLALARPGAAFGDYELLRGLGSGGMGVVFEARHKRLNRIVALKMIKAGILADERQIRLFRSEAGAVAAFDHPHIVPVLDSGEHQGVLYYSMKRVDGKDLGRCLDSFRDRPAAIGRLVARVAEAIAHAHQRGVLHRDIKPSNILVDERGEPHVIDFGLAMRLGSAAIESTTGHPVGTPGSATPAPAASCSPCLIPTTSTQSHNWRFRPTAGGWPPRAS